MNNWVFYLIFFGIWIVITIIRGSKKAASQQRGQRKESGSKNTGNVIHQTSTKQQVKKPFSSLEELINEIRNQSGMEQEEPVAQTTVIQTETPKVEIRKTLKEERQEQKNHYSEELLVQNYTERHAQGKTLEHHLHKLDSKPDPFSMNQNPLAIYEEAAEKPDGPSPIKKLLGTKSDLRRAVILNSIFERKG